MSRHWSERQWRTQGSQFTSAAFTGTLAAAGIRISMDARGRWMDNVRPRARTGGAHGLTTERLWRSLKYEDVCLKGYSDGREARARIGAWIAFYNHPRPHQALGDRTPMAVWRDGVAGPPGGTAADMTLRLDNADAVAHMPTAATTAGGSTMFSGRRNGDSN